MLRPPRVSDCRGVWASGCVTQGCLCGFELRADLSVRVNRVGRNVLGCLGQVQGLTQRRAARGGLVMRVHFDQSDVGIAKTPSGRPPALSGAGAGRGTFGRLPASALTHLCLQLRQGGEGPITAW